ncbi:hypothetical protein AQJ30_20620 [Streptomyces longwoodensis]|uniref:Gram-positive cocci surface proteins LPxTG domain-containing protein n=1 Tax=Streptomyces longwoodensis TaxID=68231 RepID=A0A124HQW2_9ACTN|nr:hypothetical protein [Streptomyces longwoodensis]KUN36642.1 hypothetical protein AQJ30_20620 [Streptomyces longwoodensis]
MTMRPTTPAPATALGLALAATMFPVTATAAAMTAATAAPAPAPASLRTTTSAAPSCDAPDAPDAKDFPLTTRLRGGPAAYEAGGGYGTWSLDLTNTTDRTCTGVHPVVVLVDARRALRPSQPLLEFYADGRPHPVRFQRTDEDELVGAFDGFPGFTVGPRATVTVRVRLAFTSDTVPDGITADAAVVQRHGDDGDWVGQSADYRFTVTGDPAPTGPAAADPGAATPAGADPATPGAATAPGTTPAPDAPSGSPSAEAVLSLTERAGELARTGLASPVAATAAAVLLAAGTALVLARRRR